MFLVKKHTPSEFHLRDVFFIILKGNGRRRGLKLSSARDFPKTAGRTSKKMIYAHGWAYRTRNCKF